MVNVEPIDEARELSVFCLMVSVSAILGKEVAGCFFHHEHLCPRLFCSN